MSAELVERLRAYAEHERSTVGHSADAEAFDEAADTIDGLLAERDRLREALRFVDFHLNGFPEALRTVSPHQSAAADGFQEVLVKVRAALTAPKEEV